MSATGTTPEERAAELARHEGLLRRLQAAIDRYRALAEEQRRARGAGG